MELSCIFMHSRELKVPHAVCPVKKVHLILHPLKIGVAPPQVTDTYLSQAWPGSLRDFCIKVYSVTVLSLFWCLYLPKWQNSHCKYPLSVFTAGNATNTKKLLYRRHGRREQSSHLFLPLDNPPLSPYKLRRPHTACVISSCNSSCSLDQYTDDV